MHGRGGGLEHFEISKCMGGDKISMPPMVGVRIFSGTNQCAPPSPKSQSCSMVPAYH